MSDAPKTPQAPRPGPEHAVFAKDVGTWDVEVEIRPGPGAAPIASTGVTTSRLACGGMWLLSDFVNETTGFEGHGVFGYDPAKKHYVGTWVDPMRTFLSVGEGSWDEATETMTFTNESRRPDGQVLRWRETTTTRDADTLVWRQYFPLPGGGEFEMMTATYRRRK